MNLRLFHLMGGPNTDETPFAATGAGAANSHLVPPCFQPVQGAAKGTRHWTSHSLTRAAKAIEEPSLSDAARCTDGCSMREANTDRQKGGTTRSLTGSPSAKVRYHQIGHLSVQRHCLAARRKALTRYVNQVGGLTRTPENLTIADTRTSSESRTGTEVHMRSLTSENSEHPTITTSAPR